MAETKRQLAAIMFTDIVGYTTLMGENSNKALELVHLSKDIQKPLVEKHGGKWLKEMGDGVMAQFSTALDAVHCAIEIQQSTRADFDGKIRIGIHLGDITIENNDVYGDGVNVASRIESVCDPGGIYISESIEKAIRGRLNIKTQYLGELEFKNVGYEVRIYAIADAGYPEPKAYKNNLSSKSGGSRYRIFFLFTLLILIIIFLGWSFYKKSKSDKKTKSTTFSIAVLPFTNLSNDPSSKYFVDGIMDEILNNLSKFEGLRVISKASSMRFSETPVDIISIVKELGVSHILIGSVYKDESNYRINSQLVLTAEETQVWAGKFDGRGKYTINLLDSISLEISKALSIQLTEDDLSKLRSGNTENDLAYDYYLKSRNKNDQDSLSLRRSIQLNQIALNEDSLFSLPYLEIANSYRYLYWRYFDRDDSIEYQIQTNLEKAFQIDATSFEYLMEKGMYHYHIKSFYDSAVFYFEKAANINKNNSDIDYGLALVYRRKGNIRLSTNYLLKGLQKDPLNDRILSSLIENYNLLRMPDSSIYYNKKLLTISPDVSFTGEFLIRTFYSLTGNYTTTKDSISKYLNIDDHNKQSKQFLYWNIVFNILDRNYSEALQLIPGGNLVLFSSHEGHFETSFLKGIIYHFLDSSNQKKEYLERSLLNIEDLLISNPNDSRLYSMKGLIHAYLDNPELAIKNGNKGVELVPYSKDAWKNHYRLLYLAKIQSLLDNEEEALVHIRYILEQDFGYSRLLFKKDPIWDNMRDNPEFLQLIN